MRELRSVRGVGVSNERRGMRKGRRGVRRESEEWRKGLGVREEEEEEDNGEEMK